MNDYNILLCSKIKSLRQVYGYTQSDMAQKLNVKRETYSHFEQGKSKKITIDMLLNLAEILHVDISEFLPVAIYRNDNNNTDIPVITINAAEKELLILFRQLPVELKQNILSHTKKLKIDYLNTFSAMNTQEVL